MGMFAFASMDVSNSSPDYLTKRSPTGPEKRPMHGRDDGAMIFEGKIQIELLVYRKET